MIHHMRFILFIAVLMIIALSGCDKEETLSEAFNPITAGEKYDNKQFWHGKLIHSMLTQGIHPEDFDRHLYFLQALIRQTEVYEKCAQVGADLSVRAIQIESKAIGQDLPNKLFIEGQTAFVGNDPGSARSSLEMFLKKSSGEPNPLRKTAQLYLQAIDAEKQFMRLFLTPTGEMTENLPSLLEGTKLTTQDLLTMEYNFSHTSAYDCGESELCSWDTPDLSVYPFLTAKLVTETAIHSNVRMEVFNNIEGMLYQLLFGIVEFSRTNDGTKLELVLQEIETQKLSHSREFETYYQIAMSLTPVRGDYFQAEEHIQPLMLLRALRNSENEALRNIGVSQIYDVVLPSLFNSDLSTEYRDYVYVELWNFLWMNDKDLLEKFRLNKGYSPGVVAPDFFIDLLPYRVTHPRETRLGNKDLKTQVQHHPYLRLLISSYEYISEKSRPDNAGKTGVG
jgi:hypothetical protein